MTDNKYAVGDFVWVVFYESHGYEPELKAICKTKQGAFDYINKDECKPYIPDEFSQISEFQYIYCLGSDQWIVFRQPLKD